MRNLGYICFEQLVINSPVILSFFPKLADLEEYGILKQHADTYGLGRSRELKKMLEKNNVRYGTTERIYNEILEKAVICGTQKFGKKDYIRAVHHFILKGKWSVCWTVDCTRDCPADKCWEATGNNLMCTDCCLPLKGKSSSCIYVNADVNRKYAEEKECVRQMPKKLAERIRLMFGMKEIKAIDEY